jgi:hypothetical protein
VPYDKNGCSKPSALSGFSHATLNLISSCKEAAVSYVQIQTQINTQLKFELEVQGSCCQLCPNQERSTQFEFDQRSATELLSANVYAVRKCKPSPAPMGHLNTSIERRLL